MLKTKMTSARIPLNQKNVLRENRTKSWCYVARPLNQEMMNARPMNQKATMRPLSRSWCHCYRCARWWGPDEIDEKPRWQDGTVACSKPPKQSRSASCEQLAIMIYGQMLRDGINRDRWTTRWWRWLTNWLPLIASAAFTQLHFDHLIDH